MPKPARGYNRPIVLLSTPELQALQPSTGTAPSTSKSAHPSLPRLRARPALTTPRPRSRLSPLLCRRATCTLPHVRARCSGHNGSTCMHCKPRSRAAPCNARDILPLTRPHTARPSTLPSNWRCARCAPPQHPYSPHSLRISWRWCHSRYKRTRSSLRSLTASLQGARRSSTSLFQISSAYLRSRARWPQRPCLISPDSTRARVSRPFSPPNGLRPAARLMRWGAS
jgi:hypothetical protein